MVNWKSDVSPIIDLMNFVASATKCWRSYPLSSHFPCLKMIQIIQSSSVNKANRQCSIAICFSQNVCISCIESCTVWAQLVYWEGVSHENSTNYCLYGMLDTGHAWAGRPYS